MSRAVLLVHGVQTSRRAAEAWARSLGGAIEAAVPDLAGIHLYEYGWVSAVAVRFPWIGAAVRRRLVRHFQRWVAGIAAQHGPGIDLDAVGYSFGSYLVGHSMTDKPGPRAVYGSVVLMGSILSAGDDWKARTGHYRRALNLYSREDGTADLWTPHDEAGRFGFRRAPASVTNADMTPAEHSDYQRPGPAWDGAVAFLSA